MSRIKQVKRKVGSICFIIKSDLRTFRLSMKTEVKITKLLCARRVIVTQVLKAICRCQYIEHYRKIGRAKNAGEQSVEIQKCQHSFGQ